MTVVMLIALAVWAAMLVFVLALCISASRGDAALRLSGLSTRATARRFGRSTQERMLTRQRGLH